MSFFLDKRYPVYLLIISLIVLALSAINVPHPDDFKLEHYMTIAFYAILIGTYHRFRLSNISYTLIFVFLLMHFLGAHYTYAEVPYDAWAKQYFGVSIDQLFGFGRNMYDRLVHFSFGLLFFYPAREIFMRIASAKGFWGFYLPLDLLMASAMIYELIEWQVAMIYGGTGVEMTYLGTQGDVWDAHKDMALAAIGGLISAFVVAYVNFKLNRQFGKELKESFTVKGKRPLGEVKIEEWIRKNSK